MVCEDLDDDFPDFPEGRECGNQEVHTEDAALTVMAEGATVATENVG